MITSDMRYSFFYYHSHTKIDPSKAKNEDVTENAKQLEKLLQEIMDRTIQSKDKCPPYAVYNIFSFI